jgi:hypothetical protein
VWNWLETFAPDVSSPMLSSTSIYFSFARDAIRIHRDKHRKLAIYCFRDFHCVSRKYGATSIILRVSRNIRFGRKCLHLSDIKCQKSVRPFHQLLLLFKFECQTWQEAVIVFKILSPILAATSEQKFYV